MSKYIFSNQEYCQMETLLFSKDVRSCLHFLGPKEGRQERGEGKEEGRYIDKVTR